MASDDLTFEDFMAARWDPLFRTAYLLTGQRHDAEDLLQTALARTCVRWDAIRDKGAADAYVRRAMLNLAQRQWRRRGREVTSEHLPEPSHDALGLRADHLALWAEVRKLPDRMRATLVLRYFEDLSVEATARELGCSEGAVKSQTHHAVRRLRAALPTFELSEELS
jgi:RNA polymerase sigma-70 factor (sigma-E family)